MCATSLMGRWKLALNTSRVRLFDWPPPRFCVRGREARQRRGRRRARAGGGEGAWRARRKSFRQRRFSRRAVLVSPVGDGEKRERGSRPSSRACVGVERSRARSIARTRPRLALDADPIGARARAAAFARAASLTLGMFPTRVRLLHRETARRGRFLSSGYPVSRRLGAGVRERCGADSRTDGGAGTTARASRLESSKCGPARVARHSDLRAGFALFSRCQRGGCDGSRARAREHCAFSQPLPTALLV